VGIILACMADVYACRGNKGTGDIIITEVNCEVPSSNMTRPSVRPSVHPVIHPWHGGDNHVAIDLIVQHIRIKLGQHDFRKIYPNVYVIQSTFKVCSYFVHTECSNNVQRQTTCEPKLQTNKTFLGSLCGKMAIAS